MAVDTHKVFGFQKRSDAFRRFSECLSAAVHTVALERYVPNLVSMSSKRYLFDAWERDAEAWYRSRGLRQTRVAEKLEPAGWAAWWAGSDIASPHPSLESLTAVANAHRESSTWIAAGFAVAGHELALFRGVLPQQEIPLVISLTVPEIRKALAAARAGYDEPKGTVIEWAIDSGSLPDNPYLRLLEAVSLLSQWERAHSVLRSTMDSWLTRMAWRRGIPLQDLASATGRPVQWVRHKVGGTPPPRPVVALDWWRGQKQMPAQFG